MARRLANVVMCIQLICDSNQLIYYTLQRDISKILEQNTDDDYSCDMCFSIITSTKNFYNDAKQQINRTLGK
jgi:hypothetical protein